MTPNFEIARRLLTADLESMMPQWQGGGLTIDRVRPFPDKRGRLRIAANFTMRFPASTSHPSSIVPSERERLHFALDRARDLLGQEGWPANAEIWVRYAGTHNTRAIEVSIEMIRPDSGWSRAIRKRMKEYKESKSATEGAARDGGTDNPAIEEDVDERVNRLLHEDMSFYFSGHGQAEKCIGDSRLIRNGDHVTISTMQTSVGHDDPEEARKSFMRALKSYGWASEKDRDDPTEYHMRPRVWIGTEWTPILNKNLFVAQITINKPKLGWPDHVFKERDYNQSQNERA